MPGQARQTGLNSAAGWFVLVFFMCVRPGLAQELSTREQQCLAEIEAEVAFITSRVELIHDEYEKKLETAGLQQFQSGDYSTIVMLDNSIRKYHLSLVRDVRRYPQLYRQQLQTGNRNCPAEQLKLQGIGMIHSFERDWTQALEKARQNAEYFQRLEQMN